jgi:hypothetical protein
MRTNGILSAIAILLLTAGVSAQTSTRETAEAKIAAALANKNTTEALAVYDAYVVASKRTDLDLLRPIARFELELGAQSSSRDVAADALERLARAGDAETLTSMRRAAASTSSPAPEAMASMMSLARAGDLEAQARLAASLGGANDILKVQIVQLLQNSKAKAQAPAVAALLDDASPNVRGVAAVAVGALDYREAIPKLRALAGSDQPTVKMLASTALARFGDTSADPVVANLLRSEQPEMRLLAAEALQGSRNTQWMTPVKELRNDRNPTYAVRAAEIIACCDPEWSKGVLIDALTNPMVVMRLEAARALDRTGLVDARVARRMLGDSSQIVRIYGAGAALNPATKPAAPATPKR